MTTEFQRLLRIGIAAEVLAVACMMLALAALVGWRRHRARDDARRLADGRSRLAQALQHGDMHATHAWLMRQPPRIQLILCRAFVLSVQGATRRDLQQLALRVGVLARAVVDVRSRRWERRLRGIRVLEVLAPPGFEEELSRAAQHDPHAAVRQAADLWYAATRRTASKPFDQARTAPEHGGFGFTTVDEATRALASVRSDVRSSAIRALAGLEHWPAAAVVYALLDDPQLNVRREAATALHRFGAPGRLFLRRALIDTSERARDAARHTLDLHHAVLAEAQ